MIKQEMLFRELNDGKLFPLYLLLGEEEAVKEEFIGALQEKLFTDDDERLLNSTIYYGDEAEAERIVENLTTYSLVSPRKLVVVKDFDRMKSMRPMMEYLGSPASDSVLVLWTRKNSAQNDLLRAIEKNGRACIFWPMFQNEAEKWVEAQLDACGIDWDPEAVRYLLEVTGTDRNELRSQIECIVNFVAEGELLTLEKIKQVVALLNTYSVFDLCNSLFLKTTGEILRIFRYLLHNGEDLARISYFIGRELAKLLQAYAMQRSGNTFSQIRESLGFRKKESERIRTVLPKLDFGSLCGFYSGASSLDQIIKSSHKDVCVVAFEKYLATLGKQEA